MKFGEGNVFTGVCLSTWGWLGWVLTPQPSDPWDMGYYRIQLASEQYASYYACFFVGNEYHCSEYLNTCLLVCDK